MKKRTRKIAMLCMSALLFVQAMPVWAAGGTEIALNPGKAQEGSQVQVACEITNAQEVTNGKIRIHYDASKLVLTADSAGGALSGALCEVNDCLTGNKEEGEIVAAFASSTPLAEDGSLLDMTFQLADGVKAGDTADIQVDIEELAGDSGNIGNNETHTASITVEAKGENPNPGGDDHKPGGDDNKNPGGDDGSQGSDKNDGNGNKGTTPATTPAKKSGNSTTTSKSAKTGDDTNILFPVLGVGAAAVVIAAVAAKKKKES
ncbi:LPXTG cell wall anchor domain-containing protein [Blautia pseudococcoides]|nr:LPXTG cell wall anchor domain-containing protein [uncultured Blautia sp.]MCR2021200.1 LPXTG cell wall anchor domain-containing protein [Blautia pseudococcoides]